MTHTRTLGRTLLDEGSARRRELLKTHAIQKIQTAVFPGGIRTRNPNKRAAAYLLLRPSGHWDRLVRMLCI